MHVSLSELATTIARAVRGVGLPAGLGEDAAAAAREMTRHGVDSGAAMLPALVSLDEARSSRYRVDDALEAGRWRALDGNLLSALWTAGPLGDCLVSAAAGRQPAGAVRVEAVDAPAVVLFSLLAATRGMGAGGRALAAGLAGTGEEICCHQGLLRASPAALDAWLQARGADLSIRPASGGDGTPAVHEHVAAPEREGLEVDDGAWHAVERYAARLLVEASELSRLRGAGAGLADND